MKVGVNTATKLKEKSIELSIPFSNLLWGFVLEDMLDRIAKSSYKEHILLADQGIIGVENYKRPAEGRLTFYYKESEKKIAPEKQIPGQILAAPLLEAFCREILEETEEVLWRYSYQMQEGYADLTLSAWYHEMSVPLQMRLVCVKGNSYRTKEITFSRFMDHKPVSLLLFAPGNQLGECFFEIMKKLELILDMSAYDAVNEILKTESVSGRHILEELHRLCEKEPRVCRLRRMEQLESYLNYKYMENRWEKYRKAHHRTDSWQEVLARLISFGKPIWTALCEDEIFFDDWMPELGRYLG